MNRRPRVAVVGIHGHGRSHVERAVELEARGEIEIWAIVDPRPPEPGILSPGVEEFRDLQTLLDAGNSDIVVLCTPIHTHFDFASAALSAGADVLLEKPPTATLSEFERLSALAAETGRAVQVGFQSLGSAGIDAVRAMVAADEIGELQSIAGVGSWPRSAEYWTRASWSGKRTVNGVPVVDGVVTNPLAHAVATALAIAGTTAAADVREVVLDQYRANDIEVDDTSSVLVRTTSGVPLVFGLALTAPRRSEPAVILNGKAGRIVYYYTLDVAQIFSGGASFPRTVQFARTGLLANLVEHRVEGVPLVAGLDECGGFMRVLEAVRVAPDPRPIDPRYVTWVEDVAGRRAVVDDIERWISAVADEQRTFAELGAPWATGQ